MIKITFKSFMGGINSVIIFLILAVVMIMLIENRFPMLFRGSFKEHDRGLIVGETSNRANSLNVDLQHLMYESPEKIKYSDYYMMEIIVLDRDLPHEVKEMIASANDFSIYLIGATVNVVFFEKNRNDIHKLLDSYGYIKNISYPRVPNYGYSKIDKNDKRNYILYEMSFKDTNGDDRINDKDSTAFFISDLSGRNLKQITPFSMHYAGFSYSEDYNQIYFEIVEKYEDMDVLGHYLKSRKLSYYDVKNDKFHKFEELDRIISTVQQEFKL